MSLSQSTLPEDKNVGLMDRFKKKQTLRCETNLLSRVQTAHEVRNAIEAIDQGRAEPPEGFTEDRLYELLNENLNEFDSLEGEFFRCEEMDQARRNYWSAHAKYMHGYILTRAHMAAESENSFIGAYEILGVVESSLPYPSDRLVEDTRAFSGGRYISRMTAWESYAGALAQQDRNDEATAARLKGIELAREHYSHNPRMIAESLRKAGEHVRLDHPSDALTYFNEAIYLVAQGTDLADAVEQGDMTLLYLKDMRAFQLDMLGMEVELAIANSEIEPYKENISWRLEGHVEDSAPQTPRFKDIQAKADQGLPDAQFALGRMYDVGEEVTQDHARAIELYKKAAEQEHDQAQHNLGHMYYSGHGVPKDDRQAISWYTRAAENGNENSQFNLGIMYDEGDGVNQDLNEAHKWYLRSAEQGYADAQYNLATLYLFGAGVVQDKEKAAYWLAKSVEQGNINAHYNLGIMYYTGDGVPINQSRALELYSIAAKGGHAWAQYNVAVENQNGDLVEKNVVLSYALYSVAAHVLDDAEQSRLHLSKYMSSDQVNEATILARDLYRDYGSQLNTGLSGHKRF